MKLLWLHISNQAIILDFFFFGNGIIIILKTHLQNVKKIYYFQKGFLECQHVLHLHQVPDIEYDHFAIVELQDKAILEVVEHFAVLGLRCGIQAGIADLLWHRVSVNKIRGIFVLYRVQKAKKQLQEVNSFSGHYYKSKLPYRAIYIGYLKTDVIHDAVTFLKLMPSIQSC